MLDRGDAAKFCGILIIFPGPDSPRVTPTEI
jgi:hypothetical protein